MAVGDAVRHASRGQVSIGYQCILAGMHRAREFAASGETWADDLVREYDSVLRYYEDLVNNPHAVPVHFSANFFEPIQRPAVRPSARAPQRPSLAGSRRLVARPYREL